MEKELAFHLERLIRLCRQGNFRNGVKDQSGYMDEGETIAGWWMDDATKVMKEYDKRMKSSPGDKTRPTILDYISGLFAG